MPVSTERGLDRLTFFTDALAAIAITLLVLPLVDSVPEAAREGTAVGTFLADQHNQIIGFLISFVVIARLWRVHHAIFEHVRDYDRSLMQLTLLWAFTIVVLPLPTAIISEMHVDRTAVAFYIGNMAVSSMTLTALSMVVARKPELELPDNQIDRTRLASSVATSLLFLVALVLGVAIPGVKLWAMCALILSGLVTPLVVRFGRRWVSPPPIRAG